MDAERSPSTVAGRYELRGLIGRGGMGEVYAAWDHQLEREVALKRLRQDVAPHPAMRARVEAEARIAAKVIHPNVVTVFDSGVEDGHPFIVMERLEGRTLADELRPGPMAVDPVRSMAVQVLEGLGAAHRLGLIHRDVKPSNVLSTMDGGWKVADFGIAKVMDSDVSPTATNEVLGSPAYMAPERVTGEPSTERSDLYSVGVVMYEALTGRKPFDDEHPVAIAMRVREGDHEPLASLFHGGPALAAVVERAMALDPEHRFATAREMVTAVKVDAARVDLGTTQPLEGATQPLEPMTSGPVTGATRWQAHRVLGAVLVAAVITIAVLTIAAFGLLSGDDGAPALPDRSDRVPAGRDVPVRLDDALDRLEEAISR